MAGSIKTNSVQLGDSATATQNFVLQTNVDGTAKLSRGNVGATTQDILTVDAAGGVKFPQNVVAFSAYQTTPQTIASGAVADLIFNIEEFDTASCYNAATGVFQPNVAGYYQMTAAAQIPSASRTGEVQLVLKNNTGRGWSGTNVAIGAGAGALMTEAAALVYLNGTSDNIRALLYLGTGGTTVSSPYTTFSGILIARA